MSSVPQLPHELQRAFLLWSVGGEVLAVTCPKHLSRRDLTLFVMMLWKSARHAGDAAEKLGSSTCASLDPSTSFGTDQGPPMRHYFLPLAHARILHQHRLRRNFEPRLGQTIRQHRQKQLEDCWLVDLFLASPSSILRVAIIRHQFRSSAEPTVDCPLSRQHQKPIMSRSDPTRIIMSAEDLLPGMSDVPGTLDMKTALTPMRVRHYKEYLQKLLETDASRLSVATAIAKLPIKIQNTIFEWLAVASLPNAMHFSDRRPEQHLGNSFRVPTRIQGTSTLEAATHLLLSGMRKMQPVQSSGRVWTDPVSGKALRSLKTQVTTDTSQLVGIFAQQIEEAIIKSVAIKHAEAFPTKADPDRLPFPKHLRCHSNHIRGLYLIIKLGADRHGGEYYPNEMFNAQDGIPGLHKHAPNLMSLTIHVVEHTLEASNPLLLPAPPRPTYVARLPWKDSARHTSVEAEIVKVIIALRGLAKLKERVVRFTINTRYSCGYSEAWGFCDATEMEAPEAGVETLKYEGSSILV